MAVIPYSRQSIDDDDIAAVAEVLRSPFLTQGPAITQFEEAFAQKHGGGNGVAVCNATAALHIACLALGVGPGDRVWTSPNSFVASANCARFCGGTVDFVDIDPATRNMSVSALAEKLADAEREGALPKVVIPVDFSGLPAEMPEIRKLANQYGFAIIQDSSHAVGAQIDNSPVGARFADIAVFSFHPVKILTTGEGGLCLTLNAELADKLRLYRSHGVTRNPALLTRDVDGPWYYEQVALGFNYRITDIQAALGTSQLGKLDGLYERREILSRRYDEKLAGLPLKLPARIDGYRSAHHLYVIETIEGESAMDRSALFQHLLDRDIRPNVHYIPIHTQPDYLKLGFATGMFSASEQYYANAITIPLYPELTEDEQDWVVNALQEGLGG
jgi:UDP-4-amino-4,6-dideoxy-N-acetyl-beta-L-altrosamine transaminase